MMLLLLIVFFARSTARRATWRSVPIVVIPPAASAEGILQAMLGRVRLIAWSVVRVTASSWRMAIVIAVVVGVHWRRRCGHSRRASGGIARFRRVTARHGCVFVRGKVVSGGMAGVQCPTETMELMASVAFVANDSKWVVRSV